MNMNSTTGLNDLTHQITWTKLRKYKEKKYCKGRNSKKHLQNTVKSYILSIIDINRHLLVSIKALIYIKILMLKIDIMIRL